MVTSQFKKIYIIITISLFSAIYTNAQRCEKKKLAPKEWLGDYDYTKQTTYTQLAVGDTIRMKTVVYSQYDYRIFAVGEHRLGKLKYRILIPEKKFNPIIDKIVDKQITVYERDHNGFLIYDENEEPIPKGTATIKDTVWTRRLITTETEIFTNDNNEDLYWESKIQKTRLLVVEIIIPKSKNYFYGCVALMVGQKPFSEKTELQNED